MSRKLRIEYPGAMYRVMNRGDQREDIFMGWAEDALLARRKGHGAKVRLARRLRQETTMSLKWIAQRLHRGSWTYVSNLLNEPPQTHPEAQEVLPLCQ
jgi:hypothetical protein